MDREKWKRKNIPARNKIERWKIYEKVTVNVIAYTVVGNCSELMTFTLFETNLKCCVNKFITGVQ